ncbi:hypothetical protein BT96DRAFT_1007112 [Gymnopus androsaceus JB14]|uniref:Uncharacterized protein n=1 Tax=Gymnopus androsaceus JB14 TaxID=1447944 RepID=A0A6A4GJ59_9AGAR|nr:hypothetical protein BT96DRAFT_1007112 [Gymnopus androsaceus JB14]
MFRNHLDLCQTDCREESKQLVCFPGSHLDPTNQFHNLTEDRLLLEDQARVLRRLELLDFPEAMGDKLMQKVTKDAKRVYDIWVNLVQELQVKSEVVVLTMKTNWENRQPML